MRILHLLDPAICGDEGLIACHHLISSHARTTSHISPITHDTWILGTSADEQLRVYQETNDLKAVVDRLMELTLENVPSEVDLSVGKVSTAQSTIAK